MALLKGKKKKWISKQVSQPVALSSQSFPLNDLPFKQAKRLYKTLM